jgi:hypothetical protein
MATAILPITEEVKVSAVFSTVIYEAHRSSVLPGDKSHERLSRAIGDPAVKNVIGVGWQVSHSTQDFALFVNPQSKQASFVCRGSYDIRDWLGCNFPGGAGAYNGRMKTILNSEAMKAAKHLVEKEGYHLTFTGHSLGGSLATALDAITQLGHVVTFNAPELSFQLGKYQEGRRWLADKNKEFHYRLDGELVSLLHPTHDTRAFHKRGSHAVTLPYNGESIITPHGMKQMVSVITNGTFEGVYDSDVYGFKPEGRISGGGIRKNENGNHELSLGKIEGFEAAEVRKTVQRNVFFEIETSILILRNDSGSVLSSTPVVTIHASEHIQRALETIKQSLLSQGINWLSVAGNGSADARTIAAQTTKAAGVAFVSSLADDAVQTMAGSACGGIATGLGGACVKALQAGDAAEALHTMYVHVANAIVKQAADLPLAFGSEAYSAVGQIFGSRCLSAQVERQFLDLSLHIGTVGIHSEHTFEVIALGDGQTIQRETHAVGIHAKTSGVDVALGLHSGFETTSAKKTVASDGLSVTVSSDRSFKNELRLSLYIGLRHASWKIIPATSSHKRTYTFECYEDGRDLSCSSSYTSEARPLSLVSGQSQDSSSNPSTGIVGSSCMPTPETADAHNKLARILFGDQPPDTVNTHVTNRTTIHHEETHRKWIFWKKTIDRVEVLENGIIEKRTSSSTSGVIAEGGGHRASGGGEGCGGGGGEGNPAEVYTQLTQNTSVDTFQNKDGSRIQQNHQSSKTTDSKLFSKADGTEYSSVSKDFTTPDGSHVVSKEVDTNILEVKETTRNSQKQVINQEEQSFAFGSGHSTETSKPISNRDHLDFRSTHLETRERVITRVESFKDQRTENGTDFQRGEHRIAQGIETCETTNVSIDAKGPFVSQVKTENTETRNYSFDSTTPVRQYEEVPPATASTTTKVTPGWIKDTTVVEKVKDGTVQSQSSKEHLNQGSERALGTLVTAVLDILDKACDPSVSRSDKSKALADLFVNIGESYLVGLSGQMAACTKELGDALPYALITMTFAFLAREGIAFLWKKPETESENNIENGEKSVTPSGKKKASSTATKVIRYCGDAARCALPLLVVGLEIGCGPIITFCLNQLITCFQTMAEAIAKDGCVGWWRGLTSCVSTIGMTLTASCFSWITTKYAVMFFIKTTSGIFATSMVTIVVPTATCWGCARLWKWYHDSERRELVALLSKYELDTKTPATCVKTKYKKLCLEHHPDKTHSRDSTKFQEVHKDFKRIFDLQNSIETTAANKQTKEEPCFRHRCLMRAFLSKLAEHFCSTNVSQEVMVFKIQAADSLVDFPDVSLEDMLQKFQSADSLGKAEEQRLQDEAEAMKKAEEERLQAEAEAKKKAEEERLQAEAEAKKKAEEERLQAEAEAKKKAEEERLKAEAEAKKKAEEERLKAEAEAKKKAEEERLQAEAEAKKKAEQEEAWQRQVSAAAAAARIFRRRCLQAAAAACLVQLFLLL